MKKSNLLIIAILVLMLTCGTALASRYSTTNPTPDNEYADEVGSGGDGDTAPVPEPATMLLLGTGLVGLAVGVRKKKN